MNPINSSEITPESEYFSRRRFLRNFLVAGAASMLLPACGPTTSTPTPFTFSTTPSTKSNTDELGDPLTSLDSIIAYVNFYEFSPNKFEVSVLAEGFQTSPWKVQVSGLVRNPKTYDLDALHRKFIPEERIFRMRCVEGWSMVIPWIGFPFRKLIEEVSPLSDAKYVRFYTLEDHKQFPGQVPRIGGFPFPYTEGLRLDEAMNELTILATGLYGKALPVPNGAPIRLVVPWKYGFKSIKSIVKIEFVKDLPLTFWTDISPEEYGFYANVNPDVPHPRWLQNTERRVGVLERRPTLLFNGYQAQVAKLYEGMDLEKNY